MCFQEYFDHLLILVVRTEFKHLLEGILIVKSFVGICFQDVSQIAKNEYHGIS